MKICAKCDKSKKLDEFSVSKYSKDGYQFWCKQCRAEYEANRRRRCGIAEKIKPTVITRHRKQCLRCKIVKTLKQFRLNSRGRMGRSAYCIPCDKEYHVEVNSKPGRREKQREYTRQYRERHGERWRFLHKCNMSQRRARKAKLDSGLVTNEFLLTIYSTTHCYYCQEYVPETQRTCDHKIPLFRKGLHHPDNIVMACGTCNFSKGRKTIDEWQEFLHKRRSVS